jgi:hypothetical protein
MLSKKTSRLGKTKNRKSANSLYRREKAMSCEYCWTCNIIACECCTKACWYRCTLKYKTCLPSVGSLANRGNKLVLNLFCTCITLQNQCTSMLYFHLSLVLVIQLFCFPYKGVCNATVSDLLIVHLHLLFHRCQNSDLRAKNRCFVYPTFWFIQPLQLVNHDINSFLISSLSAGNAARCWTYAVCWPPQ